jgi:hypothetical protein
MMIVTQEILDLKKSDECSLLFWIAALTKVQKVGHTSAAGMLPSPAVPGPRGDVRVRDFSLSQQRRDAANPHSRRP